MSGRRCTVPGCLAKERLGVQLVISFWPRSFGGVLFGRVQVVLVGVGRLFLCWWGRYAFTGVRRGTVLGCWVVVSVRLARVRRLNVTMGDVRTYLPCCRRILKLGYCGVRRMTSRGMGATFFGMNRAGVRLLRPADRSDAVTGFVRGGNRNVRRVTFTIPSMRTTLSRTRSGNVGLVSGTPHKNTRNLGVTFLRPGSAYDILARLYVPKGWRAVSG